ncbi:MAG: hypothetical protein H8E05_00345 [Bacteroidetes bacterium]|nr:hypothetical protein [Bacteroidota bacterium]
MKKEIEIDFSDQIRAAEECDCGTCNNEECGCSCHTPNSKTDQDEAVKFSAKVVDALTSKAAEHNSNEENSVTSFEELLDSFRNGAAVATYKGEPITELALARVNLLLRVKSGHFHNVVDTNNLEKVKKTLSGLIFEDENDSIFNNELDMFASWSPQEADFEKAREDIKKFGLDNNKFKNIDELYLDRYEQIPLELD